MVSFNLCIAFDVIDVQQPEDTFHLLFMILLQAVYLEANQVPIACSGIIYS